jgi:predicted RNase H-like HicB family nuclease
LAKRTANISRNFVSTTRIGDSSYKRIRLKKEPEGGYTVLVPSLEGCITYGEDVDDAIKNAREAIELYIETLKTESIF